MVYFLQNKRDGFIKIGTTTRPDERIQAINGSSPYELRLLGYTSGGQREEAALHKKFSAHRIRGEWFRPEKEILSYIRQRCSIPDENSFLEGKVYQRWDYSREVGDQLVEDGYIVNVGRDYMLVDKNSHQELLPVSQLPGLIFFNDGYSSHFYAAERGMWRMESRELYERLLKAGL